MRLNVKNKTILFNINRRPLKAAYRFKIRFIRAAKHPRHPRSIIRKLILRFKFKDLIYGFIKQLCQFKGKHGAGYIFAGFQGINGLAAHTNTVGQVLLGKVVYGALHLYVILHVAGYYKSGTF